METELFNSKPIGFLLHDCGYICLSNWETCLCMFVPWICFTSCSITLTCPSYTLLRRWKSLLVLMRCSYCGFNRPAHVMRLLRDTPASWKALPTPNWQNSCHRWSCAEDNLSKFGSLYVLLLLLVVGRLFLIVQACMHMVKVCFRTE